MTTSKRIWIQTFIALLLLLPGLPFVLLALSYLLNRIGLQGLLPTSPLMAILKAYFALPSKLCGHDLNFAGWGGIIAAVLFYGLFALGLAFPVSKWIGNRREKKTETSTIPPPDPAAGGAHEARRNNTGMKKRILMAGAVGALVLAALFATKHLLIQYHLFRFRQATQEFMKGGSVDRFMRGDSFGALLELGYLSAYSIPIQHPHADAETRLELINMVLFKRCDPASAMMEKSSDSQTLEVLDRPAQKKNWETYVRMYLEARDDRPPVAGQAPQSGGDPEP